MIYKKLRSINQDPSIEMKHLIIFIVLTAKNRLSIFLCKIKLLNIYIKKLFLYLNIDSSLFHAIRL